MWICTYYSVCGFVNLYTFMWFVSLLLIQVFICIVENWQYLFTSSWTLVQVQLWVQPQFQAVEFSGVLWVSLETTAEMLPLPPYRQVLTCRVNWWVQYGSEAVPLAAVLAYMSSLPLSLQVLHQLCSHLIPEIFWIVFSLFWVEEFSLEINSKHLCKLKVSLCVKDYKHSNSIKHCRYVCEPTGGRNAAQK